MARGKTIQEKAAANRTRPAEIEGEPVKVRVYSGAELKALIEKVGNGKDEDIAPILAAQFLDESGQPIFTAEWFLSDECTNVFIAELAQIFIEVNSGKYKKK